MLMRELLEQIQDAIRQVDGKVAEEVLDLLKKGSPEFFELTVLDVLHSMGYGANEASVQHVGKAGDEAANAGKGTRNNEFRVQSQIVF